MQLSRLDPGLCRAYPGLCGKKCSLLHGGKGGKEDSLRAFLRLGRPSLLPSVMVHPPHAVHPPACSALPPPVRPGGPQGVAGSTRAWGPVSRTPPPVFYPTPFGSMRTFFRG